MVRMLAQFQLEGLGAGVRGGSGGLAMGLIWWGWGGFKVGADCAFDFDFGELACWEVGGHMDYAVYLWGFSVAAGDAGRIHEHSHSLSQQLAAARLGDGVLGFSQLR